MHIKKHCIKITLFTIHFKVCIIELFWLVNFGNIIQSECSLHILSEMIWFIDRPILLAPYFFYSPIRRTVTVKTRNIYKKQHGARRLKYKCVEITECKLYMCIDDTKNTRDNPVSMTRRIHNARPCVEKMQFIFFVPPNEELEGTLHPPKMQVKGYVYP
jgi:hypothetical protein